MAPLLPRNLVARVNERSRDKQFRRDFDEFKRLQGDAGRNLEMRWEERWPCFSDATQSTPFEKHYLFHMSWAARVLGTTRPAVHVDVSSSLEFACLVSAFVPTTYLELRPVSLGLAGLTTVAGNLTALPLSDASIHSLSCMHVVEHVGLGRYGDRVDAVGDLKAMSELSRVLAPAGNLLFVVPVGRPRVQFNAHRIYSYEQILTSFPELELVEFALITDYDDSRGLVRDAPKELANAQRYGCGCFWFRRSASS